MNKERIALILGTVCIVLTFAICVQMKTVQDMVQDVGTSLKDNSELKEEYLRWKGMYASQYKELETLENNLEKIRNDAIKGNQNDSSIEDEIKKNNRLLGLTDIRGSGVKIIIDDNREISSKEVLNISNVLVHEDDLLLLVNELFNSGADAISINGHRVVSTTSILCDGNIVRINNEKTGVPITINAIGYPERMELALTRPGGYLALMEEYGVKTSIDRVDSLKVPKFSGVYNYDYIVR